MVISVSALWSMTEKQVVGLINKGALRAFISSDSSSEIFVKSSDMTAFIKAHTVRKARRS